MTFSVTGPFVALWVQGWDTVNAFDVENGAASSASLFAIPSITPSQTGDVVLAGLTNADAGAFPFTIDSSLSTQDSQSAAVGMDGIVAYLVYNSTTALSPTWSASSGPFEAAYAQIAFQGVRRWRGHRVVHAGKFRMGKVLA
jgi:hypothetical protein